MQIIDPAKKCNVSDLPQQEGNKTNISMVNSVKEIINVAIQGQEL